MKINKCTALYWAALVCFIVFIISFLVLLFGDADASSQNYGLGLSMIGGIVIAVPTIIEMVKQYKNRNADGVIAFAVSSFKKENGKDMHHLTMALFFSIFPVIIFICLLLLLSGAKIPTSQGNKQTSGSTPNLTPVNRHSQDHTPASHNAQTQNSDGSKQPLSNQELNTIARSSANDMKIISDGDHKKIQKIYQENPGISDEEVFEKLKGFNPSITMDTIRAHKPSLDMTNQELNTIARNSTNNMKSISDGDHNKIQAIFKKNPGLSDEEACALFRKATNSNITVDTIRAHRPSLNLSHQEINRIAASSENKIKTISEGEHNAIRKMFKENPRLSDEKAFETFSKSHPGITIETIRAHKPN